MITSNIQKSETIANLIASLIRASAEISNPSKDSFNPHHGSKFASLGNYIDSVKRPLLKHGLIIIQGINGSDTQVGVDTMLAHESGEWISFSVRSECFIIRKDKATGATEKLPGDGQAIGSLTTYLRRYAISALLCLVGEDDDDAEANRIARQGHTEEKSVPFTPKTSSPAPKASPAPSASGDASGSAMVEFGKHKGKSISEVHAEDPEYISWLAYKRELKNAPDGKPYRKDVAFTEACRSFLASKGASTPVAEDDVPY